MHNRKKKQKHINQTTNTFCTNPLLQHYIMVQQTTTKSVLRHVLSSKRPLCCVFLFFQFWLLTTKHPGSFQTMPLGFIWEEKKEEAVKRYLRLYYNLRKSQAYLGLKTPFPLVKYFSGTTCLGDIKKILKKKKRMGQTI